MIFSHLRSQVFSAPNYVDQGGNKGAFVCRSSIFSIPLEIQHLIHQIRIDAEGTQKYIQFEAQPHPNVRPMAYQSGGLASLMM